MKILIAGLGSVGRRHLKNLISLGVEEFVLLRSGLGTLPQDELVGYPSETSLEAALRHDPQAVVVATPTASHLDVAIPAARAGCDIFLEKPISHTMERVYELQEAVAESGSRVLVGYQYRFHPGLQAVKQWVDKGRIGRPLHIHAHWGEYLPNWHPWEDYRSSYAARRDLGGGVVLTLSHPLDYLRWLFGEVERVTGWSGNLSDLELEVEDAAEIQLQFESGASAQVHLDYFQRPPSHHLHISGAQGVIRWEQSQGFASLLDGVDGGEEISPIPQGFERNDMFLAEMRHFLEVLAGNAPAIIDLEDGVKTLKLALQALGR